MATIASKLGLAFWRLLPANPILVRVVGGASKRTRHFWLRTGYLALLLAVVLMSLAVFMSGASGLNELAKGASQTFKYAATLQLGLMCFLAPVFTAGAITQERDAQTYNILLSTPLTNAQIILGSLMSRMYFLIMLLVAGLPVFFTTMVYGGVTAAQIVESFALAAATAVITGALAIFISVVRIGTRRTIFSFFMAIAVYLLAVYMLGQWNGTWVEDAPSNIDGQRMSWMASLHPFLSLDVALNRVQAPEYSLVAAKGRIAGYALAYPSATYITWTLALALLLTLLSMFFVRSGAKQGEPTIFSRLRQNVIPRGGEERFRKPRHVWSNPVAWREAKTKATAAGGVTRWGLIICGAAVAVTLLIAHLTDSKRMSVATTQEWLAATLMIEFALALLIATNTAATSMTKEKESKSMEVLLTTPLTSQYIIFGKLRGLVSFAAPLIAVPVGSLLLFGLVGLIPRGKEPLAWIETSIELGAVLIMSLALACVVCLKFSLTSKTTVKATMMSIAVILIASGILSAVGFAIVDSPADGHIGAFFAPFTPFTAIYALTEPAKLFDGDVDRLLRNGASVRIAMFIGSVLSAGMYALIVWSVYRALVRNFDMIVRKQTAA